MPVADITPAMIGAWMSEAQAAGRPLRSRIAHRATLSLVLQWAVDSGLRPINPVHVVRAAARAPLRRRRPVLKPEQWPQLRREFHDDGAETQLLVDVAIDTRPALGRAHRPARRTRRSPHPRVREGRDGHELAQRAVQRVR